MKLALSWLCYQMGDLISVTLMRWGYAYSIYNKLMIWSSALDEHGKIWENAK